MTNHEFENLQTDDAWIVRRTGVRTRYVAAERQYTSDVCIAAVQALVEEHGVTLGDVDYVIVCTSTPDYVFPSVAAMVQNHFSIPAAGAFDLSAACAGFAYGLNVAHALIASHVGNKILLIGGETMTKALDYADRATCILFGDGAGAAIVEAGDDRSRVLASIAGSDGSAADVLFRTGLRTDVNGTRDETRLLRQKGGRVYAWVLDNVPKAVSMLLERARLRVADIDWFVPHSANERLIEGLCERCGIPAAKVLSSVERYGNTSAASIPLALWTGVRSGKVARGDTILTIGFGGGLTYAGSVLTW